MGAVGSQLWQGNLCIYIEAVRLYKVVCLIWCPMTALPTLLAWFLGFEVPTYFIFVENVLKLFLFLFRMVWIFFCRYWCKLYIIWNHTMVNVLKFVHQWRSVFCINQLFMNWLLLIYRWCYSLLHCPTRSRVRHCVNSSVVQY